MPHSEMPTRIVLTGGPCAGKTTALAHLQQRLQDLGYYPIIVPEAATMLILGGITPWKMGLWEFQKSVLDQIRCNERVYMDAASLVEDKPVVMIYDRGMPDGRAFMEDGKYEELLEYLDRTMTEVRDARYDAVIHLRTAAIGAEEFYTLANNAARSESAEEARRADERVLQAWIGHPHLRVIDNSTDFTGKIKRLEREVCSILGIPVPLEIERKFVVVPFDVLASFPEARVIDIEQVYLSGAANGEEIRVRRRGQDGSYVYFQTTKVSVGPGKRIETERRISEADYAFALQFRRPDMRAIKKKRHCFGYKNQYFEYDVFEEPAGYHFLEIELTDENQEFEIPECVHVIKDVTDNLRFTNSSIALDINAIKVPPFDLAVPGSRITPL